MIDGIIERSEDKSRIFADGYQNDEKLSVLIFTNDIATSSGRVSKIVKYIMGNIHIILARHPCAG